MYFCSTERHIIKQICETTSLLFNFIYSSIHKVLQCILKGNSLGKYYQILSAILAFVSFIKDGPEKANI